MLFEGSNLSLQEILIIVYLFTADITAYKQSRHEGQLFETKFSNEIIDDWLSYCREICIETIVKRDVNINRGRTGIDCRGG